MKMKKQFITFLTVLLVFLLSSCSNSDYLNSIPRNSTAIVEIDMGEVSGVKNKTILKALLHVTNLDESGIDLGSNIFLFETVDGNLGLCARVSDAGDLEKTFNELVKKGTCTELKERQGVHFSMMNNAWVAAFNDRALLVVGPVAISTRTEMEGKLATFLSQDEEHSIKSSPMFDKLDSISAPIAMVAQAQALPEKFIAPFTLGAPKDADPSQVLIAAEMSVNDGCLDIQGTTFSFNRRIEESLRQSAHVYRTIKGRYVDCLPEGAMMAMFMNVDGSQYIDLLRRNSGFQALLAGVNAAIDMDNIIKSVDGDLAIMIPTMSDDDLRISMASELAHSKWLADVGYWKQSCPEGGRIIDWGPNAYSYLNGKTSFFFGVSPDNQFYSGSSAEEAKNSIVPSKNPTSALLQTKIKEGKVVMVVNLQAFGGDEGMLPTLKNLIRPVFGDVNTIVYSMK